MFEVAGQMVTLFSIVAVGYLVKRIGFMTKDYDRMLSRIILNVAIPGLIIGSVLDAEQLPSLPNMLVAIVASSASFLLVFAIAYLATFVFRVPEGNRGVFKFMLSFGNVGFIGFPVLSAIFGNEVLIYAAIFNLPFNLLVFTVGIWFIRQDSLTSVASETTWRTFVTPATVSCIVAFALAAFQIHGVPIIGGAFTTLGAFTTPGALLVIGSSLADLPLRHLIGGPRLWAMSVIRLIAIPLCVWAVFHFFVYDQVLLAVIVVISGMPVATNGTMLCYQYGGNLRAMAQGTFLTTVLSIASIPLLVQFIALVF